MSSYFGATIGFMDKRDPKNIGDYYPTPPIATFALLHNHDFRYKIWEPAAGKGHILDEIKRLGYECIGTDLYDRGRDDITSDVDFLKAQKPPEVENIITNPPYKDDLAELFLKKALSYNLQTIAFLCRLQFITGIGRYNSIYKHTPPSKILIFPRRLMCDESNANMLDSKKQFGGMLEYAWYIWDRNHEGKSIVEWLDIDTLAEKRNEGLTTSTLESFF